MLIVVYLRDRGSAAFADVADGDDKQVSFDAEGRQLSFSDARDQILRKFEGTYLDDLVSRNSGSLAEAARAAGMDRKKLRQLLRKHGMYKE